MKPLQSVAMGLVVVVLTARFHGYDALPDAVGWVLVVLGVRRLGALPHHALLLGLATLAGVVSLPLWWPPVADRLSATDESLVWAASLPELVFLAVLASALATGAGSADDAGAARWLGLARTAVVVIAVLPVLVFGGGLHAWAAMTFAAASLLVVMIVVLLFAYSGRSWAAATG